MKKLAKISVVCALLLCVVAIFASCGKNKLAAPDGFKLSVENVLSWNTQANVRNYVVKITGMETGETSEETVTRARINLSTAITVDGDYDIQVKAIGGNGYADSSWSNVINFEKEYETGCRYELYNNNTEYRLVDAGSAGISDDETLVGKVNIKNTYRGKAVTAISDKAFKGNSKVKEIVINEGIREIGKQSFSNCSRLESIVLPESLVSIGDSAFFACNNLTGVTIPNKITELPKSAFSYCRKLETVVFGSGLKVIGESAFANDTALTELIIPDGVTYISTSAFSKASGLKRIVFGKNLAEIGSTAFFGCASLEEIVFSESGNLKIIGQGAFSECYEEITEGEGESAVTTVKGLKTVNLPEGLVEIGFECFRNTETLENVTIPESVTSVGAYAFKNTAAYNKSSEENNGFIYIDNWLVEISDNLKKQVMRISSETIKTGTVGIADQALLNCISLEEIEFNPTIKYIGKYALYNCPKLFSVSTSVSGNLLESIGEYAFANNNVLSQVNFGESLKILKEGAFSNDPKIKRIDLSSSKITELGDACFANCTALIDISLGESLKKIGRYAFFGCSSLANKTLGEEGSLDDTLIPSSVESIGTYAFKDTSLWTNSTTDIIYAGNWIVGVKDTKISSAEANKDAVGISDYAFYNCATLTSVTGLSNIKQIGRGAFYGCSSIKTLSFGNRLKSVEEYTFYKCTSLMSVGLSRNTEYIGQSAFYKCTDLLSIDLSKTIGNTGIRKIADFAFYGCSKLETVEFGKFLESIGSRAFFGCVKLSGATMPENLKTIGDYAFYNCSSMTNLDLGNVTEVGVYAFGKNTSLTSVTIPQTLKVINNNVFYNCSGLKNLDLGSVEVLNNYAFYGTQSLESLVLPETLKSIGKYAFKGSAGLNSLFLCSSIEEINAHAFYGCKNLTIYTDAKTVPDGWNARWNSSYCPVIFGAELSKDGKYVVAVNIEEGSVINDKSGKTTISAPEREGYEFVGWATEEQGEAVYSATEIANVENGIKLFSVWKEKNVEPETPTEQE